MMVSDSVPVRPGVEMFDSVLNKNVFFSSSSDVLSIYFTPVHCICVHGPFC